MATTRSKSAKPAPRRRRRLLPPAANTEVKERPLKIGEASRALDVEAYVLRFWETQFPFLRPRHANSSHRMYEPKDLELLRLVKRLLHVEGYTIAGAKKHIRETGLERLCSLSAKNATAKNASAKDDSSSARPALAELEPVPSGDTQRVIVEIRDDLRALRKLLD